MVMANPSPPVNPPAGNAPHDAEDMKPEMAQHVGREFVRQYYTILNQAPQDLHRFFSHKSSFVHGGVEKPGEEKLPLCGQHAIHEKIMELNFTDCHAKIRQVDCQPTLGSGVLVQVSGELSNNQEPMRRFMQTFVLAPKDPKTFYVLNDIFRYQDETYPEYEEEEVEDDADVMEENVMENDAPAEPSQASQEAPGPVYFEQSASQISNGSVQDEEVVVAPMAPVVEPISVAETPALEADMDSLDIEEEQAAMEKMEPEEAVAAEPEPQPEHAEAQKPFTWASRVGSKSTGSAGSVPPASSFVALGQPKPARPVEVKPAEPSPAATAPAGAAQQQRVPRPPREGRFERDRSNTSRGEEGDGDGMGMRRGGGIGTKYPDSHQLFVGNLPHNISERELKVFFEQWGKVVELRINTKSSGGKLPNFGFVVFDSPGPVQDVLQEKPIKFNGEHRLNVEEKKPRGSDGRPSGRGGPRGGLGGGRGGFSGRGGMKNGGFGRPMEGERRGMGGPSRGAPSGPPPPRR